MDQIHLKKKISKRWLKNLKDNLRYLRIPEGFLKDNLGYLKDNLGYLKNNSRYLKDRYHKAAFARGKSSLIKNL